MAFSIIILIIGLIAACVAVLSGALKLSSSEPREQSDVAGVVQLGLAFAVFIAVPLGGAVAISTLTLAESPTPGEAMLQIGVQYLGVLVAVLAVITAGAFIWGRDRALPRLSASPRAVAGGLLIVPITLAVGVGVMMIVTLIARLRGTEPPDAVAHDTLRSILDAGLSEPRTVLALVGVVLIAPIVEELLYRGLAQRSMNTLLGSSVQAQWVSILGVSVVFTSLHAAVVPLHALPVIFTLSVCLGVAFARSGSLLVPIVAHVAFNAANIAIGFASIPPA